CSAPTNKSASTSSSRGGASTRVTRREMRLRRSVKGLQYGASEFFGTRVALDATHDSLSVQVLIRIVNECHELPRFLSVLGAVFESLVRPSHGFGSAGLRKVLIPKFL